MNNLRKCLIVTAALNLAFSIQSFAVERLQLSLQCSNVVLTWPSVDGDTYIIQRRADLTTNSSWVCLTNSYPAASGTNLTIFTDVGVVTNATCGSGGGSGGMMMIGGSLFSSAARRSMMLTTLANNPPPMPPLPPGLAYSTNSDGTITTIAVPFTSSDGTMAADDNGNLLLPSPPGGGGDGGGGGNTNNVPPTYAFYEVVKVGVHLYGITNGMVLSGLVPLNVELGLTDTNETISTLYFDDLADGTPSPSGVSFPCYVDQPPTNILQGTWDTTGLTNGTYTIQLGALLNDLTELSDHPVTVVISNVVSWPGDMGWGGAGVYVGAQTTFTNGTWALYLQDDQGVRHGPLTGQIASDGWCNYTGIPGPGFTINNSDTSGVQNPSTYYNLVLTVTNGNTNIVITVTNTQLIEAPWNNINTDAVLAYMGIFDLQPDGLPYEELFAMVQAAWQVENDWHFETLGDVGTPFEVTDAPSWQTLLFALGGPGQMNTRDFFYFGHGNVNRIGGGGNLGLTTALVQTRLGTFRQPTPPLYSSRQPYRFVFLDGCMTAKQDDWCLAFGIPPKKTDNATILNHGFRPRSFMGWKYTKWIGLGTVQGDAFFNTDHANWVAQFLKGWSERNPTTGLGLRGTQAAISYADFEPSGAFNPTRFGMRLLGSTDMIIDY